MMSPTTLFQHAICIALALIATLAPLEASSRQPCPQPPPTRVIAPYVSAKDTVARDVAVFFVAATKLEDVWLMGPDNKRLAVALTKHAAMLVAKPAALLEAGKAYVLQAKVRDRLRMIDLNSGGSKFGPSRVVTIIQLKADNRIIGKESPKLPKATVTFSKFSKTSISRADPRYAGRNGRVTLAVGKVALPVVTIVGRLRGSDGGTSQVKMASPMPVSVQFTSLIMGACTAHGPPAPRKGSYSLKLQPWSASGHSGKARTVKGRIP